MKKPGMSEAQRRLWQDPDHRAKMIAARQRTAAALHKNPELLAWSAANITLLLATCTVLPPMPYPSNHFDILYGISVLTHLLFDSHQPWASEIWRVLEPGEMAVFTAHGPSVFPQIARQIAN
jgi:SAM-dependent methyltransferase